MNIRTTTLPWHDYNPLWKQCDQIYCQNITKHISNTIVTENDYSAQQKIPWILFTATWV